MRGGGDGGHAGHGGPGPRVDRGPNAGIGRDGGEGDVFLEEEMAEDGDVKLRRPPKIKTTHPEAHC